MEKIIYKKSLKAKLILTRNFALDSYQALKDVISTHKEASTKGSFEHELIKVNDKSVGLIRQGRKNVMLYLNLNPSKVGAKYNVIDASNTAKYAKYPTKMIIDTKKALENSKILLERTLIKANATELKEKDDVNYSEVLYERTFAELFKEGLIKQYIRHIDDPIKEELSKEVEEETKAIELVDEEDDEEEMHKVTFTAKLLYCAENQADDLFIVTNVTGWDVSKAVKMEKVAENTFVGIDFYPTGTKLEFKICRAKNWENVEKGIWKEEIVNHHYTIGDNDLEVEDLIHNFRIY